MSRTVHKADNPQQLTILSTVVAFWNSGIACRFLALLAFIKRRIRISHPDGDSPLEFLAVDASPRAGQCLNEGGFSVIYVACSTYIDTWLMAILFDIPVRKCLFPVHESKGGWGIC